VGTAKKTTLGFRPALDNQEYARCYEQLRARVLQGHAPGPGYALLCERGLKSWIDHGPGFLADPVPAPSVSERPVAFSPPARAEMLALLATMLLQIQRREVCYE
jgi:hypothetical protein